MTESLLERIAQPISQLEIIAKKNTHFGGSYRRIQRIYNEMTKHPNKEAELGKDLMVYLNSLNLSENPDIRYYVDKIINEIPKY